MKPTPLYIPHNLTPAYALRFSWTAYPSETECFPGVPPGSILSELASLWEGDGLRLLEHRWDKSRIQLTFSTVPSVAPNLLAGRAKGRLQHALRKSGHAVKFSRKFSVRSLGDNTRKDVEGYVERQLERADLADPKYRAHLEACAWTDPEVDLARPVATLSGRYWYNLHLVLVTADRYRIDAESTAPTISKMSAAVARKHGWRIAALSVMPDHMHAVIQGAPADSPEDIALAFQNNTAWKLGLRVWDFNYYTGTVGEYTMNAVRGKD
jgi:REP element-mobilizing transposase RayT